MKEKMPHWRQFDPPINPVDRRSMGFYNKSSGSLLCPASKDWNDPKYVLLFFPFFLTYDTNILFSICRGLEDGTILVSPSDFPTFLWKNEKMDQTDPLEGFLRGDILVKVSIQKLHRSYR
jgi:hypothetical protein